MFCKQSKEKMMAHNQISVNETRDVVVPAFADSVSEGDVRWEKKVGDQVAEDDTVCEIETDKASIVLIKIGFCFFVKKQMFNFVHPFYI